MRRIRWMMVVLLAAGSCGLGWKLRSDWLGFRAKNDPQALKLRAPAPPPAVAAALPASDYSVVAQQNPFHPERNDAVPPPPPAAAAPSGPPPLIYGSMILGRERFALMATESDPKPRKVVEGEDFNGYKLAQVAPQSVVLEVNGARSEVMLYNALVRLRRDYSKTAPAAAAPAATTVAAPQNAAPETPPPGKKLMMTPFGPMWVNKE